MGALLSMGPCVTAQVALREQGHGPRLGLGALVKVL